MLKLVISVDVEEQGLFSGRYARRGAVVDNIGALERLAFVAEEFHLPLTLLATYPVACSPLGRRVLGGWAETRGAEIGAHLHPWNTPPICSPPPREPYPCRCIPPPLLAAKLEHLRRAVENGLGVSPTAFRMGRFDLCRNLLPLLPAAGFVVDSSIVPLRHVPGGADHFRFPGEPFRFLGPAPLTEAPLTMLPWIPGSPRLVQALAVRLGPRAGGWLRVAFRHVAAVGPQPAWFPLTSMIAAARLQRLRGGRVMTLMLHSSELMPGATPMFPDARSVARLVRRLRRFLAWLVRFTPLEGITLSQVAALRPEPPAVAPAMLP
jgi:hypothetical protein